MTFLPGQKLTAAALNAAFAAKAEKNNPVFTGTLPFTKESLGLGQVDNTSDLNKPVPTAVRAELARLEAIISNGGGTTNPPVDTTAPTITSSATASVAENIGFSRVLTANEPVTWSKVGGADQALFTLSGSTLTMAPKDFEVPIDNGANNVYEVQVRATDAAGNFSLQTISVTITDVAEGGGSPPTITSSAAQSVNNTDPFALSLTANEDVTWSIVGGLDAALFDLNASATGAIGFNPDSPTDNGSNNVYELTIRATSVATGLTRDQNVTITVTKPAPAGNLFQLPYALNDTTVWKRGNTNFTPNSAVALNGETVADLMYPNSTNFCLIYQVLAVTSGTAYEMSFEVKASGKTKVILGANNGFGLTDIWYDLVAQTVTTQTGVTASITALSDGWFRVKWRKTATSSNSASQFSFYLSDASGSYNCAVNGADGMLVANAQLNAI